MSRLCLLALILCLHLLTTQFALRLAYASPSSPSALWTGVNPTTVAYNPHTALLYVVTYDSILAVSPSDLTTVLANASLPQRGAVDTPVSCGAYLHLSVNDGEHGHAWLYSYDAHTLQPVRSYQAPYQLAAMACAEDGEVLLTGRVGETMVVAMRAADGERLAAWQLDGMAVAGCAVSERLRLLYALDESGFAVQVFSYTNGSHLQTLPLPNATTAAWTIAIDPTSTYLYLQAALQHSPSSTVFQLRLSDGVLSALTLPSPQYEPNDGLAALSPTRLLVGDHLSFSLLSLDFAQPDNVTRRMIGPRPLLTAVSAMAVDGEGALYVAESWPAKVLQLDGREGRLLATYELNDGAPCADRRPVAVAVDVQRLVYASLCDGRIGVYDQQQQLVRHILPLNYSGASTLVYSLRITQGTGQLYYTDAALPHSVIRYNLTHRAVAQVWTNASAVYECAVADERDGSVYGCDNNADDPRLHHYAANGTLLSAQQFVSGTATIASLAVATAAGQLVLSLFDANSAVVTVDLQSGEVRTMYTYGDGSVAGAVAVDERTGRVYVMDEDAAGVLLFDRESDATGQSVDERSAQAEAVVS